MTTQKHLKTAAIKRIKPRKAALIEVDFDVFDQPLLLPMATSPLLEDAPLLRRVETEGITAIVEFIGRRSPQTTIDAIQQLDTTEFEALCELWRETEAAATADKDGVTPGKSESA